MGKVRMSMELGHELVQFLDKLSDRECVSRTEIIRRALSVMVAFDRQIEVGRAHLGFCTDPSKLDAEMLGILSVSTPAVSAEEGEGR